MPLQIVVNELTGDKQTIALEGPNDGWLRIVIIVAKDDRVKIDYPDPGDPHKLLLTLIPKGT